MLIDAFVLEPFSANQPLIASLLLDFLQLNPPNSIRGAAHPGALSVIGDTATFTTNAHHHLEKGQAVIMGASDANNNHIYNGTYEILSVVAANEFTFRVAQTPPGSSHVAYTLWQVGRKIIERNVIDQLLHQHKRAVDGPIGIPIAAGERANPFVFRGLFVRRNIVQNVDQVVDTSGHGIRAMYLDSCERALVERNILSINYPGQLLYTATSGMKALGNQDADGQLVQASPNLEPLRYSNELIADAELLSNLII